MNRETEIGLEMPFFNARFRFTLCQKEEASGLEFMLLKMIDLAHNIDVSEAELTGMMEIFAVHGNLLPLVTKTLRRLSDLGLIKIPFRIDGSTDMKKIAMTNAGKKALEDRLLGEKEKTVEKNICCCPGKTEKYDLDGPLNVTDKPDRVPFGGEYETGCAEYAEKNTERIYQKGWKITDCFLLGTPRCASYVQKVKLIFDGETGKFRIGDNSGLDSGFVAERYTGDAFLEKLSEGTFRLPEGFVAKSRLSERPANATDYMLPCDLNPGKATVFCNPESFVSVPGNTSGLPSDSDCDMIIVESPLKGYKCWFVRTDDVFEGLKTEGKYPIVAYRNLSKDDIGKTMNGIR